MSSVGALGASYLYTAYVSIGAISDGHYHEVYDDNTSVQLLEELKSLASASADSLYELLGTDVLTTEDFTYISEIINALELLMNEAESYQNYVKTGEDSHAVLYDRYRNSAWAKITTLLGIDG